MAHKRPILLLLGLFLGSRGPVAAQTPASRIVLTQEDVTPMIAKFPTKFASVRNVSYLLAGNSEKPNPYFAFPLPRAYQSDSSLQGLSSLGDNIKTSILKQSSMPLIQLLGDRLQLNMFQSAFQIQSAPLNPFDNCGIQRPFLRRQAYPRSLCSVDVSGVSLSFHFGRDARTQYPVQGWRRLMRLLAPF